MHIIKPVWLTHGGTTCPYAESFAIHYDGILFLLVLRNTGERKDFEVYSCDVSPDGKRLVTAAGG